MTATVSAPSAAPELRAGAPWMLWRQHRAALFGVAGLFGVAALVLLLTAPRIHSAYHALGLDSCAPVTSQRCASLAETFDQEYGAWGLFVPRFFEFIPALVGAFVGAPLLAREYESGTFRFAWTQGTSRRRWVLVRTLFLAGAVTVLALGFSLLYTWWFRPFEVLDGRMQSGQAFEIEGVVFAARTLFAFWLGLLLGAVLRRTVPAIAATLAGWVVAVVPTVLYWRPHYQRPVTSQFSDAGLGAGNHAADWVLSDWTEDPAGHRLDNIATNRMARDLFSRGIDPRTWFPQHGYTSWATYQPGSRFWSFQLFEAGVLCAVSAALAAAALRLVRRT